MENENKPYCEQEQCPIHACMSKDCQIEYVKDSGPHIVKEFATKIKRYCPHQDIFSSVLHEIKMKERKGPG